MSAILNIDPEKKDDAFYRYKMPAIMTKVEGSGNGIKTVFPNIRDVCAKLNRPPELLNKFFGQELGAQSTFVKEDDKFLCMGSHTQQRIQDRVYDFITRFVLCKACRNPETDPRMTKGKLEMVCKSCGQLTKIPSTERLFNFMSTYYTQAATKSSKAGSKTEPAAAAAGTPAAAEAAAPPPAAAAAKTEPLEEDAPLPTSTKPAKIETDVSTIGQVNPVVVLADLMHQVPPPPTDKVMHKLLQIKVAQNLKDTHVVPLLWRAILEGCDPSKFVGAIQRWLPLIQQVLSTDTTLAAAVLKELAATCSQYKKPEKFPMVLKLLWEESVVPEAEIVRFVESYKSSKQVPAEDLNEMKRLSQPFLAWLKGAQ